MKESAEIGIQLKKRMQQEASETEDIFILLFIYTNYSYLYNSICVAHLAM